MSIYVGQKAVCKPKTFHEYDEECNKKRVTMTGRVSFVHPEGRFVLVEFETPGGLLRECFNPREVQFGK